jgi:predicted ester cyclase
MGEMPPTNKKVGMFMLHMATFDDANQITEEWWVMDDGTFGAQLGISPPMGRPVADKGLDGAPNIVVATDSDVEKANLAALQAGNDAFNKRDLNAMAATWAPDVIEADQGSPADTVGTKAVTASSKMFLTAFPDGNVKALKTWAAGDYVVNVASFTGTNNGPMGPMKKTGKAVAMTVAEVVKMDAAKVKHMWRFYNSFAMAKQLGLVPEPSATPPAPPPAK